MINYYLLRPDGTYSDAASYPAIPASRPDGQWVEGVPSGLEPYSFLTLNQKLEAAFKTVLPQHLGQPYLTNSVISQIMMAKVAVIDANNIDPTGFLGKATIEGLTLPTEMEADRQTLLELFPNG